MEPVCLESAWRSRLVKESGWSTDSATCVPFGYAKSTISTYNVYINKYRDFCVQKSVIFPSVNPSILADFLTTLAAKSTKPKGVLNTSLSALKAYFRAIGLPLTVFSSDIDLLITGLIKSGTTVPMQRTQAMPIKNFVSLFQSWGENNKLNLKDLRAKSIALLALSVMLRPSDIAPRSVHYDQETKNVTDVLFKTDQIMFLEDGSMKITLFGIKNDTTRTGFEVNVPCHRIPLLCPVNCLRTYLEKTHDIRDNTLRPVFISLTRPFAAIKADAVAKILRSVIFDAGLDVSIFSAKYFRPTGASVLIESGENPELVRKLGRWKCSSVFYEHYVHRTTPTSVIETLLPADS